MSSADNPYQHPVARTTVRRVGVQPPTIRSSESFTNQTNQTNQPTVYISLNNHPTSPTFDKVVLQTEQSLDTLRTMTKLPGAHLITMREDITIDLQTIHHRMTELTNLSADRFEAIEEKLRKIEGEPGEADGVLSPRSLPVVKNPGDIPVQTTPHPSHSNSSAQDSPRSPAPSPALVPPVDLNETPKIPANTRVKQSASYFISVLGLKMASTIPTFSGAAHESFSTFVRSFSDHANAAKTQLTPKKKAVFLTYLTDFARDKAEELIETKSDATFEEIRDYLKATFQDPTRAEMERQQLRQCHQRAEETVDAFSTRVRKLAQSAYVDKSREFIQNKAKEAFVDGLLFNIKFHVKGESPKTFQDVQNSAAKFELLLSEAAKANTIVPQGLSITPNATVPRQQEKQPQPQRKQFSCFSCGKEGHYA
uniref:Retrotrans_gag domain-containing protein n=1 Tax=Caenorhabditis japonica TaxID=281687 RepID=A0A8R1ITQ3_CAEJA